MAKYENLPFDRGTTFFGTGGTPDATSGANLEGQEYEIEDVDWGATGVGARPNRSNHMVRLRIVRNKAAAALLPKRLVTFKKTAGSAFLGQVDGYVTTTAQEGFPVDEFLPAAGVAVNDLFYIVVAGPSKVLTDLASGAGSVFNVGDSVVGLTAATSGATTAGRVAPQDLTGATAVLGVQLQNRVGRAMSAATTSNTNADLMVDIVKKF